MKAFFTGDADDALILHYRERIPVADLEAKPFRIWSPFSPKGHISRVGFAELSILYAERFLSQEKFRVSGQDINYCSSEMLIFQVTRMFHPGRDIYAPNRVSRTTAPLCASTTS